MELSLVIPAYNEEKRIMHTLEMVMPFMDKHFSHYEVLVIDDGSRDKTVSIVQNFGHPHLHIASLQRNMGKGMALKQGMLLAKGKYIFFMDADLPYPLESINEALAVFYTKKADLVIGARDLYEAKSEVPYPALRKITSASFSLFINTVLHLNIPDTQCGFKGFTRSAVQVIFPQLTIQGFGFDFEMLFLARKYEYHIERIPVNLRHSGDSKVHIVKDSIKMVQDALHVRMNDWNGVYSKLKEVSHEG
ncbi:dolichyl-phosphate beta-glucosyltransferase [Aneurinibacillus terranovensis]|uniref:dolichyl-phosphate beta-glucosyltransferase n=1 Tax=Aneurinibacillus terranovensis TaxID=278991 RepID=UPI00138AE22D|nr:dolichyl-phosphate beta-glucosyltransferase [Aneurinibacillus terranovensis]